jgi:hypothetical protein
MIDASLIKRIQIVQDLSARWDKLITIVLFKLSSDNFTFTFTFSLYT